MAEKERRSYDNAINEIAINVNTVMTRQEDYIKQIDACAEQTKKNTEAISPLKIKMKIVTWVGGACTLTGLSVIGRWIYVKISSHV